MLVCAPAEQFLSSDDCWNYKKTAGWLSCVWLQRKDRKFKTGNLALNTTGGSGEHCHQVSRLNRTWIQKEAKNMDYKQNLCKFCSHPKLFKFKLWILHSLWATSNKSININKSPSNQQDLSAEKWTANRTDGSLEVLCCGSRRWSSVRSWLGSFSLIAAQQLHS